MEILFKIYLGLHLAHISVIANENFMVVSSFNDEDILCPVLQRIRTKQHFPFEEDERTKNETCRTIAESNFIQNTFPILPIVPERTKIFWKTSLMKMETNNTITGPYRPREILIGGNISYEAVFPCLTWNHDVGNFFELFISRQFDVNLLRNNGSSTPFRLVFKQDKMGKLVPVAVAEKPAEINFMTDYISVFFQSIANLETSDTNICNLTSSMKLRLCAIILNAKEYRNEITFPSYTSNDEPQCIRESVWFKYRDHVKMDYLRMPESREVEHKEIVWMVECKAINLTSHRVGLDLPIVHFYIFRERESHSYFIARDLDGVKRVVGKCNL